MRRNMRVHDFGGNIGSEVWAEASRHRSHLHAGSLDALICEICDGPRSEGEWWMRGTDGAIVQQL